MESNVIGIDQLSRMRMQALFEQYGFRPPTKSDLASLAIILRVATRIVEEDGASFAGIPIDREEVLGALKDTGDRFAVFASVCASAHQIALCLCG